MCFYFGTVKSSLAFGNRKFNPSISQGVFQGLFCHIPFILTSESVFGAGGQNKSSFKTEHIIEVSNRINYFNNLFFNLVGPEIDVGVVHGELSDPEQTAQRAGEFVPVQAADLG